MEIRVLRYFLTVAREGGINKAAEVLHITQPTLSRQLAGLEDEVGAKLFDRGSRSRGVTLTSEGMLLRRRAEEILSLVDRTQRELAEQDELEGRILIGCGELAAVQLLPEMISAFRETYPRVTYDIFTATADVVKEQMEQGLVDIGILMEPIEIEKFDFVRLKRQERWVVLMGPDDPLTQKNAVSAADLQGKPLILPARANVRNELYNWLGDTFSQSQVLFTSNLATNSALLVQAGLGYSIVIEGAIPFWDRAKIASRPLSPAIASDSVFAWKRSQPLTPAVARFVEQIKCFAGITSPKKISI
ncbi:MAG: LysR family transcriptional regulator [Clostridiales bacterium]|nr:LysR family transcriptional regulator [Clostridiales bacterium]